MAAILRYLYLKTAKMQHKSVKVLSSMRNFDFKRYTYTLRGFCAGLDINENTVKSLRKRPRELVRRQGFTLS